MGSFLSSALAPTHPTGPARLAATLNLGALCVLALLSACHSGSTESPARTPPPPIPSAPQALEDPLQTGKKALAASEYAKAEKLLRTALSVPRYEESARRALGECLLLTAKHSELESLLEAHFTRDREAALLLASSHRRRGQLKVSLDILAPHLKAADAYDHQVLAGEILREMGQREDASRELMRLVDAYNEDRIEPTPHALALVGRAAHLLGSPDDANDAFNQSETAGPADLPTLMWRSELFLERHDITHAEEVANEAAALAPHHPDVLVLQARIKLEDALDFDAAESLARAALQVDPTLSSAHVVRAGIAIRDAEFERAREVATAGLEFNPRSLPLLATRAAAEFLSAPPDVWQATEAQVLKLNPHYASFYLTIAEYADWEHRYTEITDLMQRALLADPEDAAAFARLGFNRLREGEQHPGLQALRRAFARDPYNVRVFNTLNLYEKVIANDYSDVSGETFNLRYPTVEQPVLERYVPRLLHQAHARFVTLYSFTPEAPTGVEMYTRRSHFSVRTSGLPHTAIQGVCFGRTLASLTPAEENFNMPMTLWHELAHVFHIQLSRNRVPRWFTEGLAEYETQVARPEWRREMDPELFDALRKKRLPNIGQMTRAFTHAEDLLDVAVAYYQSTQIVSYIADRFGRPVLSEMLRLWGRDLSTEEVVQHSLGIPAEELDRDFQAALHQRLVRFASQFVPSHRVGDPTRVRAAAKDATASADALAQGALLSLAEGDTAQAVALVDKALKLKATNPQALWLKARLALKQGRPDAALKVTEQLLKAGLDGYETQMLRAQAFQLRKDTSNAEKALARAHDYDPTQAAPLWGLTRAAPNPKEKAEWLRKLVVLEEHDADPWLEYLELLADSDSKEIARAATALVNADLLSPKGHIAAAKALERAGLMPEAAFEWESATLCPKSPLSEEAQKGNADFRRRNPGIRPSL